MEKYVNITFVGFYPQDSGLSNSPSLGIWEYLSFKMPLNLTKSTIYSKMQIRLIHQRKEKFKKEEKKSKQTKTVTQL